MAQGIPTTRAGSIVTSDTMIVRDPLYTGNAVEERASTVLRIAPTFFRFGSFEIFNQSDLKTGNHRLRLLSHIMHGSVGRFPVHSVQGQQAVTCQHLTATASKRQYDWSLAAQCFTGRSRSSALHGLQARCLQAALHCTHGWLASTGRSGPSAGRGLEHTMLPQMLDHIIHTFFPAIWRAPAGSLQEVRCLLAASSTACGRSVAGPL